MIIPDPFAYPVEPHRRKHGPAGYADYRDFKPWLRDEFVFRCVYCLFRERWYPNGSAAFSVDHVVPKIVAPELINSCTNCVYSCIRCNSLKRARITIDPTEIAYGKHLRIENNGRLSALSSFGQDLIDVLYLNEEKIVSFRLYYIGMIHDSNESPFIPRIYKDIEQAFGFPSDLPDLKLLKPPDGNSRSGSENDSHHARRDRGELGKYY